MRYAGIILEGLDLNPKTPPRSPGTKGTVKRSKPLNLLIRLEERYEEIMGFFEYHGVPLGPNHLITTKLSGICA